MDCQKIKEYLFPFIDGELDKHANLLVKGHISACPLCNLELEEERKINSSLRTNLPKENAPYELKEKILNSIEGLDEKETSRIVPYILKPALVGVTLSLLFIILLSSLNKPFPVFSATIKEHILFLQRKLSIDIASDKPNEVSGWLQAKLDFKVMAPDLSSRGAKLVGARVCSFKDRKVAYIMYEKDKHNLSVFMFEAKRMRFPKAKKVGLNNKIFYLAKEKGYNSALWINEGIACVFVSSLDETELLYLASL